MRMARSVVMGLTPHLKPGSKLDANDYMLFPDDAHDLPDDVPSAEKAWMLKLGRITD